MSNPAVFYRGAGIGTYWHGHDARISGFSPILPGAARNTATLKSHVIHGTLRSPYISLTKSFGVAADYARMGRAVPNASMKAYVYVIHLPKSAGSGVHLLDPLVEILSSHKDPLKSDYHHDGVQDFLLSIVKPSSFPINPAHYLQPPPAGGTLRAPNLTDDLQTMVRALRDSEILAVGTIPASCVVDRIEIP